jgi:hypothetical protein
MNDRTFYWLAGLALRALLCGVLLAVIAKLAG